MCGRLNVIDDPLSQIVSELFDIDFQANTNKDIRPTNWLQAIASRGSKIEQFNATWGIKPQWAKKLLINAKAETALEKPTFKNAMHFQRCLVPCSGWYEWQNQPDKTKIKYLFNGHTNEPLLMAGLYFCYSDSCTTQIVTMTIRPNSSFAKIHHRMPLLIKPEHALYWLNSDPTQLTPLLTPFADTKLNLTVCN